MKFRNILIVYWLLNEDILYILFLLRLSLEWFIKICFSIWGFFLNRWICGFVLFEMVFEWKEWVIVEFGENWKGVYIKVICMILKCIFMSWYNWD